jgi:hypothetical protein
MRNPVPVLLLAAALMACSDGTGPEAPATDPADAAPAAAGTAAARDALERIAPALGDGAAASTLRAGLTAAAAGRAIADAAGLDQALDELAADPAYAPEADAIRLALTAHD